MTVATLGLIIDSSQAAPAVAALNRLTASAKGAEVAAMKLAPASVSAMRALGDTTQVARKAADAHAAISTQAAQVGQRFKGVSFEARNLGFQLVDVTQGALMGQSAFQIFAQQAGQIAQIAAFSPNGLGGLFRELGKTFAAMITPMRLLGAGAVATGVAAYAMNSAWKSSALELDNVARAAGLSISQLRALESAAAVRGIDSFADDAKKFAASLYDAQNGMGGLGQLLRVNGQHATDFESTLQSVSSIIQRASTDQQRLQLLQQAGLPATMEWVRLLQQGPDAIRAATNEAKNFSASEQELINKAREFDEQWNRTWRNFKAGANTAIVDVKAGLSGLSDAVINFYARANPKAVEALGPSGRIDDALSQLNGYQNPALQKALNNRISGRDSAADPNAILKNIQNYQTMISLLGDIATTDQVVKAKQDALTAAFIQSGVSVGEYRDAILALTRVQADYSRASLQAQMGVQTFNPAVEAQKELTANIKAGLVPLDQQAQALVAYTKKWEALGEAAQVAGSKFPQLTQWILDAGNLDMQLDRIAVGSLNSLTDSLVSIANGTNSASDAFRNLGLTVVTSLQKMLIQMMIVEPIARALRSALGFSSGGIPSLEGADMAFKAKGDVFGFAQGSAFANSIVNSPTLFKFANGGKLGVMGEAGPEAIMPLTRTAGGDLGVRMVGGGGGASVVQTVNVGGITVNGSAGTAQQNDDLARKVGREVTNSVRAMVAEEMRTQMRPGGLLH